MRKILKKILSYVLSVIMLMSVFSALAFAAENDKNDVPVIFVDGIASSDIINTETGESAFPPSANTILSGLSGAIAPLVSSLIGKDYSSLAGPINEAVIKIFEPASCDENGSPVYPTVSDYVKPTSQEIAEKYTESLGYTATDAIWFSYDWRLDMVTLASQLHDFIEYVLNETGAEKVNIMGFSMGTCVVMSYLHEYDYQYVENVVILAGGYNGVSTCGEPFSNKIALSSEAMIRFINTMLGKDFGGYMLQAVIDSFYQAGVIDGVIEIAEDIVSAVMDDLYDNAFKETFAKMPGFWSLIPYEMYDDAKALLIGDNVSEAYVNMIDYYHYEIQGNNEQIISEAISRGINFAIISKYGSTVPPCIESLDNIGDSVIDCKYSSLGATCAKAYTTLGDDYVQAVDDGHNHLSADGMIDASTCAFPEYTWFIKGLLHNEHYDCELALCDFIFNSETQPTVWDSENYSQFLIYNNGELEPLTADNDYYKYEDVTAPEESLLAKIIHVIKFIFAAILSLFGLS